MRILEIALLVSLPFAVIFRTRDRRVVFLPAVIAGAQLLIEGYRWQMVPAYALSIFCLLLARPSSIKPGIARTAGRLLLAATWGIAVLTPYLVPIPHPDPPDGPYPVGTATIVLRDESRIDPFAPEPDTPREFIVQFWYPAGQTQGYDRAPWMEHSEIVARAVANLLELPDFALDHLVYAVTDSFQDAPIDTESGPYPVLFFSHGYGGFRAENTFQTQQLASMGYIVAAVEHTYGNAVTVFPDGRVAPHNPDTLPDEGDFKTNLAFLVNQWAGDLVFTLDTLEQGSAGAGDILQGQADFQKIGVFGHSMGGGAAVQFCGAETRCDAALAMDPVLLAVEDPIIENGYPNPLLILYSESWASDPDLPVLPELLAATTADVHAYSIEGTRHYDFSDLPSASPLAYYAGLKGPIDGKLVLQIVNDLSVTFFNRELKGLASPLLTDPPNRYPEMQPVSP